MYRGHIGWTSSKVIARTISLGFRFLEPQHRQSSLDPSPKPYEIEESRAIAGKPRDAAVIK